MDELQRDLTYEDGPDARNGVAVYATLMINYAPLPDILDSDQFFEAIALTDYAPERVPLFTCTRGGFGRIIGCHGSTKLTGRRGRGQHAPIVVVRGHPVDREHGLPPEHTV